MPILLVFIGAVTDEKTLATEGFSYFPSKFSLDGVSSVLRYGKQLFVSYGVTIFRYSGRCRPGTFCYEYVGIFPEPPRF